MTFKLIYSFVKRDILEHSIEKYLYQNYQEQII